MKSTPRQMLTAGCMVLISFALPVRTAAITAILSTASETRADDTADAIVLPAPVVWPMLRHDARHTSASAFNTVTNPGSEKWMYPVGGKVQSSPAVDLGCEIACALRYACLAESANRHYVFLRREVEIAARGVNPNK